MPLDLFSKTPIPEVLPDEMQKTINEIKKSLGIFFIKYKRGLAIASKPLVHISPLSSFITWPTEDIFFINAPLVPVVKRGKPAPCPIAASNPLQMQK